MNVLYLNSILSRRLSYRWEVKAYVAKYKPITQTNPVGRISGVQQRLQNLGYAPGRADDIVGPKTRVALIKFQNTVGLPTTGKADKETRQKLEEIHDGFNRGANNEDNDGRGVNVLVKNEDCGQIDRLDDNLPDYEVNQQG